MAVSKVVVVDGNNLIVRIDRGVAGRGITDVEAVEIDNSLYLVFTFTDGTTETVGPVGTIQYIGQAPIVVNGSTISLSTVPVNLGGTGATTAINARTNLNAANQDTTISAGTGLSGGGSLAANRTLSIANTAVTAAAYGSASKTLTATVNAQGQLTALADTNIAIANTQISGLGTMSTQNATSIAITGGTITGITDLAVADGGTGASDASGARTNLGAAASAITITAGTGLSGGGDLSANRTLSIANTAVTAAAYGSASNTLTATVNAQGQLTALAATPIAIANTQVSGLGTASVLNAGVALGVATLDAGGTVPLSQIPASIQGGVSYQGSWNAATNTPTLTSSVGSKGYYYVVSVAGSTNLNGITDWLPGDWAIFNGSVWEQIDNTDTVASVNGYVGAVVLTAADVGAPPTTRTISAGTGLTGGGDLSANRTITLADTTVTAGAYGSASSVPNYTVNAQGQLTAAASTAIAINGNQITSGVVGTANGGTGLSSFTANGVVYASSTSALATGSALTFDGTNLKLGTTSSTNNLLIDTAVSNAGNIQLPRGAFIGFSNAADNANSEYIYANGGNLELGINGSTKLTLTATSLYTASDVNVGFGTSNVTNGRLNVQAGTSATGNSGFFTNLDGTNNPYVQIQHSSAGTKLFASSSAGGTASDLTLSTPGGDLVLNASGNVGIGTSSPQTGLSLLKYGSQWTNHTTNTYPQPAGNTFLQMEAVAAQANWFGFTGSYGATTGSANLLLQVNLNNTSQQAGNYIASEVQSAIAADLTFGKMVAGATTGANSTKSEQMRIEGSTGNVGIGTSSPTGKLQVKGSVGSFYVDAGATGVAFTYNGGNYISALGGSSATLIFETGGAVERMRLDSSGNLGLGVTPSDWSSASRPALQLPNGAALFTRSGSTFLSQNFFYNSSDTGTYIANGFATLYNQANGQHQWFNAPSGTANNTAALTQAMTLDASGNLGVGTPSTGGYKLNVRTAPVTNGLDGAYISDGARIIIIGQSGATYNYASIAGNENVIYSSANPLNIVADGQAIKFSTGSERARIDSSGNLLVGGTVTEASAKQLIRYGSGSNGLTISTPDDINGTDFVTFRANNAVCGFINRVGTTSAVMYTTTSDYRLKTVIGPVANAGQRIDALQPVEYTWNASGERTRGFLAHQFQEVYAGSVSGTKDAVDADGKPVYQSMQASTSEVIADLVAELQALRARVASLESSTLQ